MANVLQELLVRIGADTSGLSAGLGDAIEALETTGDRANRVGQSISKAFSNIGVSNASAKIAADAKRLQSSFELLEKAFKDGKISAADYAKAQDGLRASLEKLTDLSPKFDRLADSFKALKIDRSQFQIADQVGELSRNLGYLEKAYQAGRISAADFARAQKAATVELERLNKSDFTAGLERLQDRLATLGGKAKEVGMAFSVGVTAPVLGFVGVALKAAADMEALELGLKAVTKETGPLEAQLKRLQEVAKLPGLGFKEAVQGSINLQAAGFSANVAERGLKAFGNALATVGKGKSDLDGVITALTQIASKGKVFAEEINQLSERLPQIRVAMKDAFGTSSTEELAKMGIDSETFITKIIEQLERLKTVNGSVKNTFENIRDEAAQAMAAVGKGLLPFASAGMNALQPLIALVRSVGEAFAVLPAPIQASVIGITGLAVAIGPATYAVGALMTGFGSLAAGVLAIGPALAGLPAMFGNIAVAVQTGMVGALTAGETALLRMGQVAIVAGAAFAAWKLGEWAYSQIPGVKALGDSLADAIIKTSEWLAKLPGVTSVAGQSIAELQKTTKGLEETATKHGVGIKDLSDKYRAGTLSLEEYNKELNRLVRSRIGANTADNAAARAVDDIKKSTKSAADELKTAQKALTEIKKAFSVGAASQADVALATERVRAAFGKVHPELHQTGVAMAVATKRANELTSAFNKLKIDPKGVNSGDAFQFKELEQAVSTIEKAYQRGARAADGHKVSIEDVRAAYAAFEKELDDVAQKSADAWNKLVRDSNKAAADVTLTLGKAYDDMKAKAAKPVEITVSMKDRIGAELYGHLEKAAHSAQDLERALKLAGVAQVNLDDQAEGLYKAWEKIVDSVGKFNKGSMVTDRQADQARLKYLEAEIAAQRELGGEVQKYQQELTRLQFKLNELASADDAYRESGMRTLTELQEQAKRSAQAYEIIGETGKDSITRVTQAQIVALESQKALAVATGESWAHLDFLMEQAEKRLNRIAENKGLDNLRASVANLAVAFNDAFQKITEGAGTALVDALFGDAKIGPALTRLWNTFKASMKDALKDAIETAFIKPLVNGLQDALSGVISGFLKKLAGSLPGRIGGWLGGVFGGSGGSAAGSVAGGAASAAGAAAQAGGGASSALSGAMSGAAGWVGAIGSIANAVVSGIGLARLEGTMNQVERNTAAGSIHLRHILEQTNKYWPAMAAVNDRFFDFFAYFASLMTTVEDMARDIVGRLDQMIAGGSGAVGGGEGETVSVPGAVLEQIWTAITDGTKAIVAALGNIGVTASADAKQTHTIIVSSSEELTKYLGDLQNAQKAALDGLAPELRGAINDGKLSDLTNGQDQFAKDAIAEYVRITNELEQVKNAINALKPSQSSNESPAPSNPNGGAQDYESMGLDVSRIHTNIVPTNGGFDTSAVLGGLAAFSDRMAGYWDKLLEMLSAGVGLVANATQAAGKSTQEAIGTVSNQVLEVGTSVDGVTAAVEGVGFEVAATGDQIAQAVKAGIGPAVALASEGGIIGDNANGNARRAGVGLGDAPIRDTTQTGWFDQFTRSPWDFGSVVRPLQQSGWSDSKGGAQRFAIYLDGRELSNATVRNLSEQGVYI